MCLSTFAICGVRPLTYDTTSSKSMSSSVLTALTRSSRRAPNRSEGVGGAAEKLICKTADFYLEGFLLKPCDALRTCRQYPAKRLKVSSRESISCAATIQKVCSARRVSPKADSVFFIILFRKRGNNNARMRPHKVLAQPVESEYRLCGEARLIEIFVVCFCIDLVRLQAEGERQVSGENIYLRWEEQDAATRPTT